MRLFHVIPRARIAAVAAAVLATSVSAFGQSGQTPHSPSDTSILASAQVAAAQAATDPGQAGPVRRLSMDEAVRLALEQNLGIRIQRMDPQVQDLSVATARASWAPTLTTAFNRNAQTLQPTSAFSGSGSNILNSTFSNQV